LSAANVELVVDSAIRLPDRANLIIYRLIQELLTNAIKHAEAIDIRLSLDQQDDSLFLLYTDNGKGFDYSQAYQKRSFGLKNIETRAQMLHGSVVFETKPGHGLRVIIVIPTKG
jgi:signal transduction histidine kinase